MDRARTAVIFLSTIVLLAAGAPRSGIASTRGLGVSPDALPEQLRSLDVKHHYIHSLQAPAGTVVAVRGHAVVLHRLTGQAYFTATGDTIFEDDTIYTLAGSRCRIRLLNEDIVSLGESASIAVEEFIDDRDQGRTHASLSLAKGKALFYMLRLFRHREATAEVNTPTATVGIRGTKFGVQVRPLGGITAARPLLVAANGPLAPMHLAANDEQQWETIVMVFEGEVDVNGETLEDGMTWDEGEIYPTDPEDAEKFLADTEGGEGGGETGAESGDGGGSPTGAEGGGDDSSDVSQDQTVVAAEQSGQRPTTHYGYFTGMLTKRCGEGGNQYHSTYISKSRQNFNSAGITAENSGAIAAGGEVAVGHRTLEADGSSDHFNFSITSLETDSGPVDSGLPAQVQAAELGHNQFLEWGYWTQPDAMSVSADGNEYFFDNRGYYVYGDFTSARPTSGTATYSGEAHGTCWTGGGGADMSGSFSSAVNFQTGAITDFDLAVSGGSYTASISNATGSFTGSAQFEIDGGTGIWSIGDASGTHTATSGKNAYGSLYGPNADAMGGVWRMSVDRNGSAELHATGAFAGTKQ